VWDRYRRGGEVPVFSWGTPPFLSPAAPGRPVLWAGLSGRCLRASCALVSSP